MLSDDQLRQFATDGYLVIPRVVSEEFLADADAEIDAVFHADPPPAAAVGKHFYFLPPQRLPAGDAALRRSGALDVAAELVAPRGIDHGLDHIQLALNIPPYSHRPGGPHIDGHRPHQTEPDSFTMLAAIFLSNESDIDSGNLWVWPGSHLLHQQVFVERGPQALLPVSGHAVWLDPPVHFGTPTPVLARRGDLLLAHFLLGHNTGGNTTASTRRILYYRLACPGHRTRWAETFLDPFIEYEPVRIAQIG